MLLGLKTDTAHRDYVTGLSSPPAPMTEEMKKSLKELKNLWGYEEFIEFCQDFNIKSTALLTGIQAGDAYLTIVPLDLETNTTKGLSFHHFCQLLLCISLIAYREYKNVTPINKVFCYYSIILNCIL